MTDAIGWDDSGSAVPVSFPVTVEDDIEEELIELIESGQSIMPVVREIVVDQVSEIIGEAIVNIVDQFSRRKRAKLCADALRFAYGGYNFDVALNGVTLANKHGVTKQHFYQLADQFRQLLGLPELSNQRSKSARGNMSERNYRNTKCKTN